MGERQRVARSAGVNEDLLLLKLTAGTKIVRVNSIGVSRRSQKDQAC